MKVYKFGGASIKDAQAVQNLKSIIDSESGLCIIVSAMGKTTNHLEKVVELYLNEGDWRTALSGVVEFHRSVLGELNANAQECLDTIAKIEHYAMTFLEQDEDSETDFIYDQIVSLGEILSTKIIESFLNSKASTVKWLDARKLIHTNNSYKNARVNWEVTREQITEAFTDDNGVYLSQGFVGGGDHNRMTTLGREGSDYSAAIFAHCLDAESVTIWKDVAGMLNADPSHFSNTTLLPNISYREAVELSYYGASVIHPKTIKPLENKQIPLQVKSFLNPDASGTLINQNTAEDRNIPSYIFSNDQILLSISSRDFSFIVEEHISELFDAFARHGLKIQTMQNSAISFSVSLANEKEKIDLLIRELESSYKVLYNDGLELLTIRHYNEPIVSELIKDREILLEQKTRQTMRVLMRAQTAE
ncbi:MAG: aspartate kinase [Flavobacteriales bacterium]|jgi:aspartate kinase|nr:aspartate kinase [Flavobacteriales bacterium]NCG29875.1 aspartate kinase [Bacteroidota bacterium]MBT3963491.1 aspartate kinase [Flavobacteriales bacterium]MBT4705123.1 aspartate kinase [Flavobacteriales bacterium]MBT4930143.1 aspartate kinase [Flavobacteriales bacterium]